MAVTADAETDAPPAKKSSRLPLILGLVLGLVGAGGGFFATRLGILPFGSAPPEKSADAAETPAMTEKVVFVALEPITVTLPPGSERQMLRLTAQLDVAPENEDLVRQITPRIVDILNTYLRAVQTTDLETPTALLRLRTQMLHRVQVVAGEGIVRDLLITEFILN